MRSEAMMVTRSLSVRALDTFLNRQILASPSGGLGWWRTKIRAKRLLDHCRTDAQVERLARRMLAVLRQPLPARRAA
jgi:hypothetical protein